jgi:2-hydroxy-3-oxopropionate reductase
MEILQTLRADGCGSDDHSGIAKYYEKISGTQIGK